MLHASNRSARWWGGRGKSPINALAEQFRGLPTSLVMSRAFVKEPDGADAFEELPTGRYPNIPIW